MSAANTYCYTPQKQTVISFLKEIGAIITSKSPHAIRDADELRGLDHINFFVVNGHQHSIPHRIWDMLRERGAIVIEIDDAFARANSVRIHHARETMPRRTP
jgi:hypothetical protein